MVLRLFLQTDVASFTVAAIISGRCLALMGTPGQPLSDK